MFQALFGQFRWLESIDKLLLGLWKAFYYSGKNRNILRCLQEAYGIKALNLVKAVVTRWLSHGAACKRCRERYHIIIEALDDIISTTNNPEPVTYRNTLLDTETAYQITFLKDVLSVTNILLLLLQSDKKYFSAIARSVNTVIEILKNIGENIDTNHLKNFKNANDIIEKIEVYERQNIVSSGTHKRQKQDHNLTKDIFHKKGYQAIYRRVNQRNEKCIRYFKLTCFKCISKT